MSIATQERPFQIEALTEETFSQRIKKLCGAVLRRSIHVEQDADISMLSEADQARLEEIQNMPLDEFDHALAAITAMAGDWQHETGDIPLVITDEVQSAAHTIIENWEPEDYTMQALLSLGYAYDITHDQVILDKTLEVVHEQPGAVGILPAISVALEQASDSDRSFSEAYDEVRYNRDIPFSLQEKSMVTMDKEEPVPAIPYDKSDWEWLYDKNASPKPREK